jgi:hypothetical protein
MLSALLNALIRLHIAYFLWEVMTHQDDPRFAGKAIPIRNLVIVGGMSMLFPLTQAITKRWRRYPWGWDALYLSLYWLDMAGNSFDLYDSYKHFDLIPHCHGAGAIALVLEHAFGLQRRRAFLVANAVHVALETQESLTDVFFGTHNVRAWWDQPGDLLAGLVGTLAYPAIARRIATPARRLRS